MAMKIKLTKQQQQYLAAGVVLLGAFGFVYFKFFWIPFSERIAKAEKEIEEVTRQIDKAKQQAARMPRIEAELALLNQQAVEAEKRLPRTKSVPGTLVALTQLGQKYDVHVLAFSAGGNTKKEFFFELFYPVQISGSFHNIGKFLAALSLEERIYNVQNVVYGAAAQESGIMNVSFTLISYQYNG